MPDVPRGHVGARAVAAVHAGLRPRGKRRARQPALAARLTGRLSRLAPGQSEGVDERSPETRRKLRTNLPAAAFIGTLLTILAVVAVILLVIWGVGGCGAEGGEGP